MPDDKNGAGVVNPYGHGLNNNYTPSPIDRLTTHSVDQRILATLERIEALLVRATASPFSTQGLHQSSIPGVPSYDDVPFKRGKRSPTK